MIDDIEQQRAVSLQLSQQLRQAAIKDSRQWQTQQLLQSAVQNEAQLSIREVETSSVCPIQEPNMHDLGLGLGGEPRPRVRPRKKRARPTRWIAKQYVVLCKVFNINLPLGTISGRYISKKASTERSDKRAISSTSWRFDVSLYTMPSLTSMVFQLNLGRSRAEGFTFKLRHRTFNPNPELKRLLDSGDVDGLLLLFDEGKAHPQDLMAPYGNSLLHVSSTSADAATFLELSLLTD